MPSPIILASGSPRRKDLMTEAGLEFEVMPSPAEEVDDPHITIDALVSQNARLKCLAIAAKNPDSLVIGADTLVAIDNESLGKPKDLDHAFEMLKRLVGKTHVVCTGVCLYRGIPNYQVEFIESTQVTFKPLSDDQIREYLGMINPLDKAGSYAAQEHGEFIIEKTEGSWSNVVGLPMERLQAELEGVQ